MTRFVPDPNATPKLVCGPASTIPRHLLQDGSDLTPSRTSTAAAVSSSSTTTASNRWFVSFPKASCGFVHGSTSIDNSLKTRSTSWTVSGCLQSSSERNGIIRQPKPRSWSRPLQVTEGNFRFRDFSSSSINLGASAWSINDRTSAQGSARRLWLTAFSSINCAKRAIFGLNSSSERINFRGVEYADPGTLYRFAMLPHTPTHMRPVHLGLNLWTASVRNMSMRVADNGSLHIRPRRLETEQ